MLDMKFIRENIDLVRKNIEKKKDYETLKVLDKLLEVDQEWKKLKKETDQLRHKRNEISSKINEYKKQGQDVKELVENAKQIPEKIAKIEKTLKELEEQRLKYLRKIPNIMHPDVPYGESDKDNPVIKTVGKIPKFDFPLKTHVELAEDLDIVDFNASAKISGNGFYFLKNDLARLNQALIAFARDFMDKKNYIYIEPPLLVEKRVIDAAIDTTNFENSIYKVEGTDFCLIGTAEHALLGMHDHDIIDEDKLPLKYYAYSMCFRKEIGSHGINEKGLWRTHQFNKVEQFIFCTKEQSWGMFYELLQNSEEILQALKLPYRVIEICTGDLGIWKARSFDLEVWRPTINEYGEVMSLSNCTDYQARDLNIRVRRKNGALEIIHTLNDTALATSRIMVAILENYQNKDGSVTIPDVLRKYMNGEEKILKK